LTYYNEIEPYAAQWLRNLIAAGHIAPGEVDERSIVDVRADDLRGFTQCHFFAGIGVWSYALRCAGWSDDRPVWTGSCPCQPFSAAGKGAEFADDRHLWPAWFRLIRECRPVVVFGEQVATRDALAWLDHVCADLEGEGYAIGAVDTCAAGYGAPHIRQRLYFVADDERARRGRRARDRVCENGSSPQGTRLASGGATGTVADDDERGRAIEQTPRRLHDSGSRRHDADRCGDAGELADTAERRRKARGLRSSPGQTESEGERTLGVRARSELGDASGQGLPAREPEDVCGAGRRQEGRAALQSGAVNGFWRDAEWIACRDGKARAVESGTFPLASGIAARVGRLRAYGNCIVAPQAQAFIEAFMRIAR
jgi:DNA (cytosine-5)-methyltransferase 1